MNKKLNDDILKMVTGGTGYDETPVDLADLPWWMKRETENNDNNPMGDPFGSGDTPSEGGESPW